MYYVVRCQQEFEHNNHIKPTSSLQGVLSRHGERVSGTLSAIEQLLGICGLKA